VAAQSFDPEQYKQRLQISWGAAAETYSSQMVRWLSPLTERVLSLLTPQEGQQILDVACGPGEPALSIARALNGTGRVIGTDLAEGMVAQARKRAQAEGLTNVEFRPMAAEALRFPDSSFDGVTCRLGLMIFPHPDRALREMQRVLVRGGKAEPFTVTPSFTDPEEVWGAFRDGSPLKVLLAQAPAEVVERARNTFLGAAERSRNPGSGRIEFPSEALLAVGIKEGK
jgi:SAM-dependent methyltransferase